MARLRQGFTAESEAGGGSPFVLLPYEVLLGEVDQVDHRFTGQEQVLVEHLNL